MRPVVVLGLYVWHSPVSDQSETNRLPSGPVRSVTPMNHGSAEIMKSLPWLAVYPEPFRLRMSLLTRRPWTLHMNTVLRKAAGNRWPGGGAWPADVRRAGPAVPAVEPAVRAPGEPVGEVVPALLVTEPVEDHLRLAVGPVVAVAVGDEQQIRRGHDPHAAEP